MILAQNKLVLGLFAFLLSSFASVAIAQNRWDLERLLAPPIATQSEKFQWAFAFPLGTGGQGRQQRGLFSGAKFDLNGFSYSHIVSGGPGAQELELTLPYFAAYELGSNWWNPGFALLKTPTGFQAAAREFPWFLTFLDFPSGNIIERKKPPLPGPGEVQQSQWTAIWNAGDMNQDGFDDLFFQAHTIGVTHGYSGLVDGASRTLLWRHFGPGSGFALPIASDGKNGYPDLNGDGVPDFVAGFLHGLPPFTLFTRQITALSGLDGSIIWERFLVNAGNDPGVTGRDLNGDGVADIITLLSTQVIVALDGASGVTLWSSNVLSALPFIPGGGNTLEYANPVFFEDGLANSSSNTVSTILKIRAPGASDAILYIVTLDGTTGAPIKASGLPSDLQPWLPDAIGPNPHNVAYFLGDIDNDGFSEIAAAMPTPSRDPNGWWTYGAVASLGIFGPPTLTLPDLLPLTQVHTVEFEIPSAPLMELQFIMSNQFRPREGIEVDHWETNLGPGTMLNWSRNHNMTTTLDQNGRGSILFTLPNKPGLIGEKVYFRGIVWDTTAGPGKVWTLSSLGKAEIAP